VFWGNGFPASVMEVGICGGMVQTLATIQDSVPVAFQVALNTNNVYWLANDFESSPTISKCAKSGCGGSPTVLLTGPANSLGSIAVDNTSLYWTHYMVVPPYGYIMKMPIGGGAQTALTNQTNVVNIVTDSTDVYWLGTPPYFNAGLWKCGVSGCNLNPTQLSTIAGNAYLAVDNTNVYTADYGMGSVYACPKTGCGVNPTKLANGTNIQGIATDGVDVFWTDGNGTSGWISKCAVGGCGMSPTLLAFISDTPLGIAVDATSVYWTTASGVVMRAKK